MISNCHQANFPSEHVEDGFQKRSGWTDKNASYPLILTPRSLSNYVSTNRMLSNQFFSKGEMQRHLIVGHAKQTGIHLKFTLESKHHHVSAINKAFKRQRNISKLTLSVGQKSDQSTIALRKFFAFFHPLNIRRLKEFSFEISDPRNGLSAFIWLFKLLKPMFYRSGIKIFEFKILNSLLTPFKITQLRKLFKLPMKLNVLRLKMKGIEFSQESLKVCTKLLLSMLVPLNKLVDLTRFSISYRGAVDISSFLFRYLPKIINSWVKLEGLQICIEHKEFEFDPVHNPCLVLPYKDLEYHLKKLENLKAISISINNVILQSGFCKVIRAVQTIKCLTIFDLNLKNCLMDSDQIDSTLSSSLLELENLERFTLNLIEFKSMLALKRLFEGFANMRKLKVLNLDLASTVQWQQVGLESLAELIRASTFSNLREMSLNLSRTWIDDHELAAFATSLTCLKNLKLLDLNFSGCHNLKAGSINKLAFGLKSFTNLGSLSLNFNGCDGFTEMCLAQLLVCLTPLQNCSDLKLRFSHLPVPSAGNLVLQDVLSLVSKMTYLRVLVIDVEGYEKISSHILTSLITKLKDKHLKELEIRLEKVSTINENQIRTFLKSLRDLTHIYSFKLGLQEFNCFSGKQLIEIAKLVRALKRLDVMELMLGRNKINREDIEQFLHLTKGRLGHIDKTALSFEDTLQISNEDRLALYNYFHLLNLRKNCTLTL